MSRRLHPAIPEAWFAAYQALADDIRARADGRRLLLVTHKGNWGDALIIHGARGFLHWHGLAFTEVHGSRAIGRDLDRTLSTHSPAEVYPVFTAGGAISPLYGHAAKLRNATRAYGGGVILPATCGLRYDDLGLHPETALWVRETGESVVNHPAGRFCHDMAFFTPARRFPKLRGEGLFLRRDREQPETSEAGGLDLSAFGSDSSPVWPFFAIIGAHRRIRTNRLHIAVASAICGVPCALSPGATSKIADVYAASLLSYGPQVTLTLPGTAQEAPRL